MKQLIPLLSATVLFLFSLSACGTSTQPATPVADQAPIATATITPMLIPTSEAVREEPPSEASPELVTLKQEALVTYADLVFASYQDSLLRATELQKALKQFVANPSATTQQAAKDAWLAAREPYGQTEAYRFYGGPIDNEDGPQERINAWPLDESYIDYVEGPPNAGMINNPTEYPTISKDLIVARNEVGAEENISSGYHAIEFLLWGQDHEPDRSGQRSYLDYVVDGGTANAERRGQYLLLLGDLLVEDLTKVTHAWDPALANSYRGEFLAMAPDVAIQSVLTGIGVLSKSELAGERMFTALDNRDQEDEHSCFSDNTHRDIINNAQGIRNVYLGSYTRLDGSVVSGTSLADVVEAVDPEVNAQMLALLEKSMAQVNAIHIPFDQAIVLNEERPKVLNAVMTLQDQGDKLAEIASLLGLTINTALPE